MSKPFCLLTNLNTPGKVKKKMKQMGVGKEGIEIMASRGTHFNIEVVNLSNHTAAILKQEMLAKGGEAALPFDVYTHPSQKGSALLMGSKKTFKKVISTLKKQPFRSLKKISEDIEKIINASNINMPGLQVGNKNFPWNQKTYVMGIINITPDSFSGDGLFPDINKAVKKAKEMVAQGADILDIGGESTRYMCIYHKNNPQAPFNELEVLPAEKEIERVIPLIETLSQEIDISISIDTFKEPVARAALEAGAQIINDIWGLKYDPNLAKLAAEKQAPIILMHNQKKPSYKNLMTDIVESLKKSTQIAIKAGVPKKHIIIDPGIGFAKTTAQSLKIIQDLTTLRTLGYPILVGSSRKSVVGKTLNLPPDKRLWGTAATVTASILNGANIIRVHDIREMKQVSQMTDAILGKKE